MYKLLIIIALSFVMISGSTLATTEELYWDNGSPSGGGMGGAYRAVRFDMPFDADVLIARFYLGSDTANFGAAFKLMVTPVSSGMPDEGNAYIDYDYPGGEATMEGWLDVDIGSYNLALNNGDEFFVVFYNSTGEPRLCCDDSGVAGPNNRWRTPTGPWVTSVLAPYMIRSIVDDETIVESVSLGEIKAAFK